MSNSIYLSDALDEMDGFRSVPRHPDVTVDSVYQYLFRYKRDEFEDLPREMFVEALRAEGVPVGMGYARPLQDYPLLADIPDSMPGGHPFTSGCYKGSVDYSTLDTPVTERLCKQESLTLPSNVFSWSEVRRRRRNRRPRKRSEITLRSCSPSPRSRPPCAGS